MANSKVKKQDEMFSKELKSEDVAQATRLIIQYKKPTTMLLTRYLHFGISKANRILTLLEDAKVLVKNSNGERTIILKGDAAVNAALRQLKKGKK